MTAERASDGTGDGAGDRAGEGVGDEVEERTDEGTDRRAVGERTSRRLRRARVALSLDALRRESDADPAAWATLSWRHLDTLPLWCTFWTAERREFQRLAGAVALLPSIRRCLRGDVLVRLGALVGAERLAALRRRPYRTPFATAPVETEAETAGIDGEASDGPVTAGASVAPLEPDALEARLDALGAGALVAEIDDTGVRALLFDALRARAETGEDAAGAEARALVESGAFDDTLRRIAADLTSIRSVA